MCAHVLPPAIPNGFGAKNSFLPFESATGQISRKHLAQTDDVADVTESTTKTPRTAYEKHERSRVSDYDTIGFIFGF